MRRRASTSTIAIAQQPRHLGLTATVTRSPAPPLGATYKPFVEGHQESDVDRARPVEETLDVGIVERLDADDVRTRSKAGDLELAVVVQGERRDRARRWPD